jgi:acyl-coenzyme A thioesterase PaaI-like protein
MTIDESPPKPSPGTHILADLGLTIESEGSELRGTADVNPFMYVPGTTCLRTSILVAWVDTLTGILSIGEVIPDVPVTFDLSIDLYRLPVDCTQFGGTARVIKSGRSSVLTEVQLEADGEPFGLATASFMPLQLESHTMPTMPEVLASHETINGWLTQPFAERAGCERGPAGSATIGRSHDGLNSANTIQGGLLGLVIEESALSLAPGNALTALAIHYMRPARVGPAVATTQRHGDLARITVIDAGSNDRQVAVASARYAEVAT